MTQQSCKFMTCIVWFTLSAPVMNNQLHSFLESPFFLILSLALLEWGCCNSYCSSKLYIMVIWNMASSGSAGDMASTRSCGFLLSCTCTPDLNNILNLSNNKLDFNSVLSISLLPMNTCGCNNEKNSWIRCIIIIYSSFSWDRVLRWGSDIMSWQRSC